jgi:hypothetical protein
MEISDSMSETSTSKGLLLQFPKMNAKNINRKAFLKRWKSGIVKKGLYLHKENKINYVLNSFSRRFLTLELFIRYKQQKNKNYA